TQKYGTCTITASGVDVAANRFFILPQVYSVTPTTGSVGTVVSVAGTGYGADDGITIAFGTNNSIRTLFADARGWFNTSFVVDMQACGTTTITASGSDAVAQNVFGIQPQVVSVLPTAGTVGTVVTISGSGYAANDSITVAFGTNSSIQTAMVSTYGSFSTTFTVDMQRCGTTTITAGSVKAVAQNVFVIQAQVTSVLPTAGTVGTVVTIAGTGYAANDSITVAFGTNNSIRQTAAGLYGSFTTTFTVDTQSFGTTTITASGAKVVASSVFAIQPHVVSVLPTTGSVGTIVTIACTGYAAGETINVAFGTNNSIKITSAGQYGSFSTSWTIDTQMYGTCSITVRGQATVAGNTFFIQPQVYSIVPTTGTVGTMVTVSGTGYAANDNITIAFGVNNSIKTTAAGVQGAFNTIFTVDTQVYGTTNILASGMIANAGNSFFIKPGIFYVTPPVGTVGSIVNIKGAGFAANDAVTIDFGNHLSIQTANADGVGYFAAAFTVDVQAVGSTTIKATGVFSESAINYFRIEGALYLSPVTGTVGTRVSMSGNGFGYNKQIQIRFGTTDPITTIVSDSKGAFSGGFTVDTQVYGKTRVIAIDGSIAETEFFMLPDIYYVSPISGTVGTPVNIRGTGYGTEAVTVKLGVSQITAQANAAGYFETVFTMDTQSYGTKTVIATGQSTDAVDSNTFFVKPQIYQITPTHGTVGTIIDARGTGFGILDTINMAFGNNSNIVSSTADGRGYFAVTFTVDTQSYGWTTIVATGVSMASSRFFIEPQVYQVSPNKGTVGTLVSVAGSGYAGNEGITIGLGVNSSIKSTNTDSRGWFATSFVVDTQSFGTATVMATGISSAVSSFF
ncbi:MAG: hypothetical protein AAB296_01340, partial [Candidatus Desantisbacteria bacterium]